MPAIVKRLTEAGLLDVDYAAASLDEAAKFEPRHGVYTVSNTFHRTQTLCSMSTWIGWKIPPGLKDSP